VSVSTLKQPVALIPLLMSGAALATVLVHLALFGTARQADEGAEAHLWQLLMLGQIPFMAFFAFTLLGRGPGTAVPVLGVQVAAAVVALAPIYLLRW
jgi:hypothetical protein